MPQVPQFLNRDTVQIGAPSPHVDPAAAAAPYTAAMQGGAEIGDIAGDWLSRYGAAKRQADAANHVAGAAKQLDDAQFRWSKVPDNLAAQAGFDDEARKIKEQTLNGINDPLVSSYVTQRLDEQVTTRSSETRRSAFALESSAQRGNLDARLNQYAQSAAETQNPLLLKQFTDQATDDITGAVAGGWLHPEEGETKHIGFISEIQRVKAEQDRNAALASRDPQAGLAWAQKVSDPRSYPGLLPPQREALAQRGDTIAYRLSVESASKLAHEDAVAERNLRRTQATNETQTLAAIYSGKPPDLAGVVDMATKGQISPSGLEAIHSAMNAADKGRDDPSFVGPMWGRVYAGQATQEDLNHAIAGKQVSTTTADSMSRSIAEIDKQGRAGLEKAAFDKMKTALSGAAIEQGGFAFDKSADKQNQAQLWTDAQGEYGKRVFANHEDPMQVSDDIVARYGKQQDRPEAWPRPRLGTIGSTQDAAAIAAKTQQALEAGQLTPAQFESEKALILRYQNFYQQREQTNPGTTKPGNGPRATSRGVSPTVQ